MTSNAWDTCSNDGAMGNLVQQDTCKGYDGGQTANFLAHPYHEVTVQPSTIAIWYYFAYVVVTLLGKGCGRA
uniref:Uncharacterized protein n=1 Tax=Romanomermis culicivorax TaxID=13658 RepID=A0A915J1Q7_ROMCU